jgi:hypothetical protein
MQITKTDYLSFRFCRKDLWLKKNRPDEFPPDKLSEFQLGIVNEGKEVDEESQNLFPGGIKVEGDKDVAIAETKYHINSNVQEHENKEEYVLFQAAIENEPYYIRTDILKWNPKTEGWELYEVKATTKVKKEKFNNHIYDLAFQYNVCKKSGFEINKIGVIHMNKDYRRDGDLNYNELFATDDVTEEVFEVADVVSEEMDLMLNYLNGPEEKHCQCRYRTRSAGNHCATFEYSNPDIPAYAVHDVTRISGKKLGLLIDDEILAIEDIPDEFQLSDNQIIQVQSAKKDKPLIDTEQIAEFLGDFKYPLYFLDYESYLPAVPRFNQYGPYQNIVFQYSLHVLDKEMPNDGDVEWLHENVKHAEFLATEYKDPSLDIIESLQKDIPEDGGSVIVWHKPFEMGRNKELGELNPSKAAYMQQLNDRIIDLKEIFSKGMYVHPKFKGSASIKKVLPVLAPELSYDNLPINNGADANKKWGEMVEGKLTPVEQKKVQRDLLVYCKQDTFAMVRIWQVLKNLFD